MVAQHISFSEYSAGTDIEKKYAPKDLYYMGDFSLLTTGKRVSVVGSRNASTHGLKRAEIITKELVKKGFVVVSGLAAGIDTMAHRTAIDQGGKTIAVVGTSLEEVYPKENTPLFHEIASDHLVISQFPSDYPFQRKNFPMRNQTMALISDATIIIEAKEKSGTRHQGWEALRLGRRLLIMENIVNDPDMTWPKEMLDYGAEVLTRENMDFLLTDIPYLTEQEDIVF
ncbi:MAG: DNA-processing protein DprA [Bacteroidota bacterium]